MKKSDSKLIKDFIETTAPRKQELTYEFGENKFAIGVYPVLRLSDKAAMVKEIANGVFTDDADTFRTYHPELLEFMRKYTTLKFFTDFKLPRGAEDLWLLLNYTPIYKDVAAIVGEELAEIFNAADEIINTRRQYLVHKTDFNSIIKRLENALKTFDAKNTKEDVDKIMESLKGLQGNESMQNIFKAMVDSNNASSEAK